MVKPSRAGCHEELSDGPRTRYSKRPVPTVLATSGLWRQDLWGMPETPAENVKVVARQILKTWWFWVGLAVIVWAGLLGVEKLARIQTGRFQAELSRTASNELARNIVTISNNIRAEVMQSVSNQLARELTDGRTDISNQIAAALQQPRIQTTIQSAVAQQASQMMLRSISPAVSNFQARLDRERAIAEAMVDSLTNVRPTNQAPLPAKEAAKPKPAATPTTPAGIAYDSESVTKVGSTYMVVVRFRKTGTDPLGVLQFAVGVYNQLAARIVGIDAGDAAIGVEKTIDTTGLEAALNFTCPDGAAPVVQVRLSGPTVLQFVCAALPEPVTVRAMTLH